MVSVDSLVVGRQCVLVVDDDPVILRALVGVFERNGFLADWATNAREAIEKSKLRHYDVVLIDFRLPDMDGIEVLIQADFKNTLKIMLTGFPSLVTGIQAEEYGVEAYLRKPIHPEELLKLVRAKLAPQDNHAIF
ncbi:MAG: response regulator [Nitrososphaerota archaeon]|jgi:DNA-binding response OmpR family regulator|nr:response regulator [Nitrososphaerota archaeon]